LQGAIFIAPPFFQLLQPCGLVVFIRSTLSDCPNRGGFPEIPYTWMLSLIVTLLETYFVSMGFFEGVNYCGTILYATVSSFHYRMKR
jgi:hypothetical protein